MRLSPLTNRNFELPKDGWYHIAPIGEFAHPTGIIQVIDPAALEAMKNRFDEESQEENFPGLLFDFDHFSNDPKAKSEAAGWIMELQNRADGLWARVNWSKSGQAALVGGDYRLASPVWNRSDCEDLGGGKFRPTRLDRCALTNDPNLKGMVPLSNRADTADSAAIEERLTQAEAIIAGYENRNTTSGAHKGWETRRGALADHHAAMAKRARAAAAKATVNKSATLQKNFQSLAVRHEKLAAKYHAARTASGLKSKLAQEREAHLIAELGKLPKSTQGKPKAPAVPQ